MGDSRLGADTKAKDRIQVFPNTGAVNCPATVVLVKFHDEWIAFPRRCLSAESMDSLCPDCTTCLPGTAE